MESFASWLKPYDVCADHNVSYIHRVDDPNHFNYCIVPLSAYDAVLFVAVALCATCAASGRLSAVSVLLAGAVCELAASRYNLGRFSNSMALWLGMQPSEVFFYTVLPPLLLDSASRIDWFVFRKVLGLALVLAFAMVAASTVVAIPIMLYGLNLEQAGWTWQHAALFAAMVASTDAVAVSASLKAGGAPEVLGAVLEAESLFNDASGLVLFEIFLEKLKAMPDTPASSSLFSSASSWWPFHSSAAGSADAAAGPVGGAIPAGDSSGQVAASAGMSIFRKLLMAAAPAHSIGSSSSSSSSGDSIFKRVSGGMMSQLGHHHSKHHDWLPPELQMLALELYDVLGKFLWLAGGGLLVGLVFGMATRRIFRWLQWRGLRPHVEVTVTFAFAYLSFYVANAMLATSGVIAVVVYGLYGAATMQWGMSLKAKRSGAMTRFWDVLSFAVNGLVFFYVGASAANFLTRLGKELDEQGHVGILWETATKLPLIYAAFAIVRGLLIAAFSRLAKMHGSKVHLPWQGVVFATVGGLRGAVSLILCQMVLTTESTHIGRRADKNVTAQLVIWTTGFVLMTLLINAPLLAPLMTLLKLNRTTPMKQRVRSKAKHALLRFSRGALWDLQHDEDEVLRGVDWAAVERFVDLRAALDAALPDRPSESVWAKQPAFRPSAAGAGGVGTRAAPAISGLLPATTADPPDLDVDPTLELHSSRDAFEQRAHRSGERVRHSQDHNGHGAGRGLAGSRKAATDRNRGVGSDHETLEDSSRPVHGSKLSRFWHWLTRSTGAQDSDAVQDAVPVSPGSRRLRPPPHPATAATAPQQELQVPLLLDDRSLSMGAAAVRTAAAEWALGQPDSMSSNYGSGDEVNADTGGIIKKGSGRSGSNVPNPSSAAGGKSGRTCSERRRSKGQLQVLQSRGRAGKPVMAAGQAGAAVASGAAAAALDDAEQHPSSMAYAADVARRQTSAAGRPQALPRHISNDCRESRPIRDIESGLSGGGANGSTPESRRVPPALPLWPDHGPPAVADSDTVGEAQSGDQSGGEDSGISGDEDKQLQHQLRAKSAFMDQQYLQMQAAAARRSGGHDLPFTQFQPAGRRNGAGATRSSETGGAGNFSSSGPSLSLVISPATQAASGGLRGNLAPRPRHVSIDLPAGVSSAKPQQAGNAGSVGQRAATAAGTATSAKSSSADAPAEAKSLSGVDVGDGIMGKQGHVFQQGPATSAFGDGDGMAAAMEAAAAAEAAGAMERAETVAVTACYVDGEQLTVDVRAPARQQALPRGHRLNGFIPQLLVLCGMPHHHHHHHHHDMMHTQHSANQLHSRPSRPSVDQPQAAPAAAGQDTFAPTNSTVVGQTINADAPAGVVRGGGGAGGLSRALAGACQQTGAEAVGQASSSVHDGGGGGLVDVDPSGIDNDLLMALREREQSWVGSSTGRLLTRQGSGGGRWFKLSHISSKDSLASASSPNTGHASSGGTAGMLASSLSRNEGAGNTAASLSRSSVPNIGNSSQLGQSASQLAPANQMPRLGSGSGRAQRVGSSSSIGRGGSSNTGLGGVGGSIASRFVNLGGALHPSSSSPAVAMFPRPASTSTLSPSSPSGGVLGTALHDAGSGNGSERGTVGALLGGAGSGSTTASIGANGSPAGRTSGGLAEAIGTSKHTGRSPAPASSFKHGANGSPTLATVLGPDAPERLAPATGTASSPAMGPITGKLPEGPIVAAQDGGGNGGAKASATAHVAITQAVAEAGTVTGSAAGLMHGGGGQGNGAGEDVWRDLEALVSDDEQEDPEALSEYRVRLVSGFKRHFHAIHLEGLLSANGYRILDYCCDKAMDDSGSPLDLWAAVETEVMGRGFTAWEASIHTHLRLAALKLKCGKAGWLGVMLSWPLTLTAQLVATRLSHVMMVGLEVALELWAALCASPQAQWLNYAGATGAALQAEVQQQSDVTWRFIIEREIEAPERFTAIQSHRAATALLRQQQAFIHQLFHAGMVDSTEMDSLLQPVERRMWRLEARGPRWSQPRLAQVLQRVAFLSDSGPRVLEWVQGHGELVAYDKDDLVEVDNGMFIVVSGIVRITLERASPSAAAGETFYIGMGGVAGLSSSLLGRPLPGMAVAQAVAEASALGKGPVVLHLPRTALTAIRSKAADGDEAFRRLDLTMLRLTGSFILERQRATLVTSIVRLLLVAVASAEEQLPANRRSGLRSHLELAVSQGAGGIRKAEGTHALNRHPARHAIFVDPVSGSSSSDDSSAGEGRGLLFPADPLRGGNGGRRLGKGSLSGQLAGNGTGSFGGKNTGSLGADGTATSGLRGRNISADVRSGSKGSDGDDRSSSSGVSRVSRRNGGGRTGDGSVAASVRGSLAGSLHSRAAERLRKRCLDRALAAYDAMRKGMKNGELLRLQPGQKMDQHSIMILINGSLIQNHPVTRLAGQDFDAGLGSRQVSASADTQHSIATAAPATDRQGAVRSKPGFGMVPSLTQEALKRPLQVHQPPALLLHLPDLFEASMTKYFGGGAGGGLVRYTAGPGGAEVLVCRLEYGQVAVGDALDDDTA